MSRTPESPFRFGVPDLLSDRGRRRDERVEAVVDWSLDMSAPAPGAALTADVTMEGINSGVYVRASATVRYHSVCHRCLQEWDHDVVVRVGELIGEGADYELDTDVVDLEPVLRDAVLSAFPDTLMCREDCRGLCSVCGADLNADDCPGHDDEPDSPFAALRDLLEP